MTSVNRWNLSDKPLPWLNVNGWRVCGEQPVTLFRKARAARNWSAARRRRMRKAAR
jgi:hypothetical protein